jgi:cysteinyl-tRNA synthetase
MSKSEGNFYTLRDLLLKGYKASAIRMLLISVPYRQQLNFTFEGLAAETGAIDRLRTFHLRIRTAPAVPALNPELAAATAASGRAFCEALANDLNTAEARAAIFDLVRAGNAAIDAGTLGAENVPQILDVLSRFDQVFAVLEDHDAEWTRFALDWAEREGRLNEAAPELLAQRDFSDEKIQALVDKRTQAKRARNFALADQIRNELAEKGIVIEDSKDGVRWKRK